MTQSTLARNTGTGLKPTYSALEAAGVAAFSFDETLPLVGAQGHIDLVKPSPSGFYECAGACFFAPQNKVWFWPLN